MEMKDRIAKIIKKEQLTSQQFAEIIEIQSSTISHILAGRNLPSFKIISNLLERFPKVSPDWLIFGKGEMYRVSEQTIITPIENKELDGIDSEFTKSNLFEDGYSNNDDNAQFSLDLNEPNKDEDFIFVDNTQHGSNNVPIQAETAVHANQSCSPDINSKQPEGAENTKHISPPDSSSCKSIDKIVDKIIIMYCDKTFEIFNPKM